MLYKEIIAVCSQIHTKHINTLRGQNVEFLHVILNDAIKPERRYTFSPGRPCKAAQLAVSYKCEVPVV